LEKRNMHPRTVAIVVLALLAGAVAVRVLVVRFGLLPASEEVVLKKAVAVTVDYFDGSQLKKLRVEDPGEVREVLATLRVQREDYYGSWNRRPGNNVMFYFPNGSYRGFPLESPGQLGSFIVDRAFHAKLCEIASRREGKPIDVTRTPPFPVPPGGGPGWGAGWEK